VEGIYTIRYEIDNVTFMINHDYSQEIPGFANVTQARGSPVFLGNPHMFMAEKKWSEKIKGMKPANYFDDATKVDIEPWTGKVLQANKSLQVNLYVPPHTMQFSFFNPYFPQDTMYPLMWAFETSSVTPALASIIKNNLYLVIKLESLMIPIFVPVSSVFIIIGLFLAIVMGHLDFRFRRQNQDYIPIKINDGDDLF